MIYHPRRCVTGQNPCNYPPGYSNSWFRSIEALVRGEKCCEMAIFQSIWSKSDPSWPLPCPTYLPFLTKRGEILKFRQKYVKVHKICYIICPNRKKWHFWGRTPTYHLRRWFWERVVRFCHFIHCYYPFVGITWPSQNSLLRHGQILVWQPRCYLECVVFSISLCEYLSRPVLRREPSRSGLESS